MMKTIPYIILLLATACIVSAQEPATDLKQLLREALFEEEATRDLAKATAGYEKLLQAYADQRQFAATALFRLAEVRRKQERKTEAVMLYQRLLVEFPENDPLARLSRENLVALGADVPDAGAAGLAIADEETAEIERLRELIANSPDLVTATDEEGWAPLHLAAKKGQLRVAEFLIERGSDVNQEIDKWGTPLAVAAAHGHKAMCELLLAKGADIDRTTPLGEAIASEHRHMAEFLLEEGADANASHTMKWHWRQHERESQLLVTMLGLAVSRNASPFVEMLLDHGADVNLTASADGLLPVHLAAGKGHLDLLRRLLDAGKDAHIDVRDNSEKTPLVHALENQHWDSAEFLLAQGANPEIEVGGKPLIEVLSMEMRVRLMRAVKYSQWGKQQAITLAVPELAYHTTLATGNGEPPMLAKLLLDWGGAKAPQDTKVVGHSWTIYRKAPKEIIEFEISYDQELPLLEWGDVIESTGQHSGGFTNARFGSAIQPILETKRSISVTVAIDGKHDELVLSDGLGTYDPLHDRAPYVPLDRLARLLGVEEGAELRVERSLGGGTFVSTLGSAEAAFELKEGDVIHVTRDEAAATKARASQIAFRSPGLLFGTTYEFSEDTEGPPSLLQLIAWQYAPLPQNYLDYLAKKLRSDEPALWPPEAISRVIISPVFVQLRTAPLAILPFPEWSRLQIRRLEEDGSESVIPVNLQEAIEACSDATTPEEARGYDRPLQKGDIVEVPVLPDTEGRSWTGLGFETARLLKKALQRDIVYQNPDGLFRALTLRYVPTTYIDTVNGYIPVPSEKLEDGEVSVPRVDHFLHSVGEARSKVTITRDEQALESPTRVWLENGDRVIVTR